MNNGKKGAFIFAIIMCLKITTITSSSSKLLF